MDCPVPCTRCGDLIELARALFYTKYCGCPLAGGCEHGICHNCLEEVIAMSYVKPRASSELASDAHLYDEPDIK